MRGVHLYSVAATSTTSSSSSLTQESDSELTSSPSSVAAKRAEYTLRSRLTVGLNAAFLVFVDPHALREELGRRVRVGVGETAGERERVLAVALVGHAGAHLPHFKQGVDVG